MSAINAVILAGDKRASKLIMHQNKAFLSFKGVPILIHVLRALLESEFVGRIAIVGPSDRIRDTLLTSSHKNAIGERVSIIEQRPNLLENAKAGFIASLPEPASSMSFEELKESSYTESSILIVPSDIPIITPYEIDEFIGNSDLENYDYCIGLTREEIMKHYYPTEQKPGIKMECFQIREGRCRQNNLQLGKPLKATELAYVERMYELRYQTHFLNMLLTVFRILFTGKKIFTSMRYFIQMQLARSLYKRGYVRLSDSIRAGNFLSVILSCMEALLGVRIQPVFTRYGGAVLDVDNETDLEILERMSDEWLAHQSELHRQAGD